MPTKKIINENCLESNKHIQPNSVDLFFTDPPYFTTGIDWDNQWKTNSEYYVLPEHNNMKPFDDRNTVVFSTINDLIDLNTGYNDFDIFSTTGSNNNNANGGLPESIAFIGDLN